MTWNRKAVPRFWRRLPQLYATAAIIGIGITLSIFVLRKGTYFADVDAYWQAAMRLRTGAMLYPPLSDPNQAMFGGSVYRYAPWFAYAWIPMTLLPKAVATALWVGGLSMAAGWIMWRLLECRGYLQLAFFGPILADSVADGNVQVLMVAGLLFGLERRSGPLWIAAAASLKAAPLVMVLVYAGRREWGRVATTLLLTAVLVIPMLAFDLSSYPTAPSRTLLYGTLAYLPVAVLAVITVLAVARTRYRWVSAAATAIAITPRFWLYDATLLLTAIPRHPHARPQARPAAQSALAAGRTPTAGPGPT